MKQRVQFISVVFLVALAAQAARADGDEDHVAGGPPPIIGDAGAVVLVTGGDADVLMRLRRAVTNWNQTFFLLPSYVGWDLGDGDPCQPVQANSWTGVSCANGRVQAM